MNISNRFTSLALAISLSLGGGVALAADQATPTEDHSSSASQAGYAKAKKIHAKTEEVPLSTGTFALCLAVVNIVVLITAPVSLTTLGFVTFVVSLFFCYWQSDHLEFLVLALLAAGFGWVHQNTALSGIPTDWATTALTGVGTLVALGLCYFNEMACRIAP